MKEDKLLLRLTKYLLPSELVDYFELKSIREEGETLHFIFGRTDSNSI
jgi:hypothetical protein